MIVQNLYLTNYEWYNKMSETYKNFAKQKIVILANFI